VCVVYLLSTWIVDPGVMMSVMTLRKLSEARL